MVNERKDLPEEASEEPEILSPEEDAERAHRRMETAESMDQADEARSLGDPDSPLRIPGELSPKPLEEVKKDRARAKRTNPRGS
jgi:hypothetical protein